MAETLRHENERLQSELDNLKAAKAGLDCWAETTRKKVLDLEGENKALKSELEKVRSQLSQQQPPENLGEGILKRNQQIAELEKRNRELVLKIAEGRNKRTELEKEIQSLRYSVQVARQQLADRNATPGLDLPEASDLLNQLKAKRKSSKTNLADIEAVLDIIYIMSDSGDSP